MGCIAKPIRSTMGKSRHPVTQKNIYKVFLSGLIFPALPQARPLLRDHPKKPVSLCLD
jgi:hypothetical protein